MNKRPIPIIHLINPLKNIGGSELRTLKLYDLLSLHAEVHLWSEDIIHPQISESYNIEKISLIDNIYPRGGTMVFVGVYRIPGNWVYKTHANRTIVIFNTPHIDPLPHMLLTLSSLRCKIEMVYAAHWMRKLIHYPGPVQPSPIDLNLFFPPLASMKKNTSFTIGRLSRDDITKHHLPDTELYRKLLRAGVRVRIMGGTLFEDAIGKIDDIELIPVGTEPANLFLKSLDCFYYRTNHRWFEPSGRVIMEAMATGLPVVAHKNGGYAEWIVHGKNGFLFETEEEAFNIILFLKNNPAVRQKIGSAARKTVEDVYSQKHLDEIIQFYVSNDLLDRHLSYQSTNFPTPSDNDTFGS